MNSKKKLFTLDDTLSFDEYAFILFQTNLKGYQLAATLNECLEIELERIDMMEEDASPQHDSLPIYAYNDDMIDVSYYLVDTWYSKMSQQLPKAINACNKVLVLKGSEAIAAMQKIYKSLTTDTKIEDSDDILAIRRHSAWKDLSDNIIDINYYDYSNPDRPISSQWEHTPKPWTSTMQRMVTSIQDYLSVLLYAIEEIEEAECMSDFS